MQKELKDYKYVHCSKCGILIEADKTDKFTIVEQVELGRTTEVAICDTCNAKKTEEKK